MPPRQKLLAKTTASTAELDLILRAEHSDPFHVLGAHPVEVQGKPAIAIRAFLPDAVSLQAIRVFEPHGVYPFVRIHAEGFFEAVVPGEWQIFPYHLRARNAQGVEWEFEDPYRFPPVLADFDLHLLSEGTHRGAY